MAIRNKTYAFILILIGLLNCVISHSQDLKILTFNMFNGGQTRNISAQMFANFISSNNIDIACLLDLYFIS